MSNPASLADALPEQQRRVREVVLPAYESCRTLPNVNVEFAISGIKEALRDAEKAAASQDVVAMIKAYQTLKEIE